MNSKRSYLDTLNTGRQRKERSPLDRITRTLDELEERLDQSRSRERSAESDITERMQRLSEQAFSHERAPQAQRRRDESLQDLARDIEHAQRQEDEYNAVGRIAADIKTLRGELHDMMTSGLRREDDVLRTEIGRVAPSGVESSVSRELENELERLSDAIGTLAERGDDKGVQMLRLELEQVRAAVESLAREETVQSVGKHWEDFDRRWSNFETRYANDRTRSDPAIETLNARLEQISEAVSGLPESLSLRSLEEKVRTLAGALDQFMAQSDGQSPDLYPLIDERLDEISRAIAASAAPAAYDAEPFDRIEARIASLAHQVEELIEDRPGGEVVDRLNHLSQRVEEIARRVDVPEHAVERLAAQIAQISEKLDGAPQAPDSEAIFRGLEDRLVRISELFEQRQGDVMEQGRNLFRDLEERLDALAERLDRRDAEHTSGGSNIMSAIDSRFAELTQHLQDRSPDTADTEALRALETRLGEIANRLQNPAEHFSAIDPEVIRNLESQVADLSAHLSRPLPQLPAFEDLEPRLAQIEHSISENRDAVVEAARRAAEEAIAALQTMQGGQDTAAADLASELKALEMLSRKADDRNNKTFEAIHDTLLKIVDRLGSLEGGDGVSNAPAEAPVASKIAVPQPPSIEPEDRAIDTADDVEGEFDGEDDAEAGDEGENGGRSRRTAAEAAAAAAEAALTDEPTAESPPASEKRSVLGGLTRAFSGSRRRDEPKTAERREPEIEGVEEPTGILDEPLEARDVNEPLEPGSGGPDLNAIMKRVRDEGGRTTRPAPSDAAKSDFIAAARRAAQAAAAEADMMKKKNPDARGSKSRFGVGPALGGRKKTVLMALVGFVVVVGAMQLGKAFLAGDGEQRAEIEARSPVALKQPEPKAEETAAADVSATGASVEPAEPMAPATPDEPERAVRAASESVVDEPVEVEPTRTAALPDRAAQADTPAARETTSDKADQPPVAEATADEATVPADGDETAALTPATTEPDTGGEGATVENPAIEIPGDAGPVALREAAASGDPRALFEVGSRYADGRGLKADMGAAATYYEKAAELGLAPAQYRIGNFYEKGNGVERDIDKAKMWYQLAAEQGNASAMHNLGVLFAMGADGAADNTSAARWFQKAAELGVKDSQFNLGILSAKGVGMEQDLEEAYKWFALVAGQGDGDAAAKRDEVANALDAKQLERARATTELWKPKELDRDANAVNVPEEWTEGDTTTASIDMKKAVATIQVILNEKGYDVGPTDGLMGDKTKAAIVDFQEDNGMQPTGAVNEQLVRALLDKKD